MPVLALIMETVDGSPPPPPPPRCPSSPPHHILLNHILLLLLLLQASVGDVEIASEHVFQGTDHPEVAMHISSVLVKDFMVHMSPEHGLYVWI